MTRATAIAILLFAAGCATPPAGSGYIGGFDRAIKTPHAAQWGEYRPNAVYELLQPCFAADIPGYTRGTGLAPGADFSNPGATWSGPATAGDFRARPETWPKFRLIEPGTRIRIEELREKGNLRSPREQRVYPRGRVLDGPLRGTTVDLQQLSAYRVTESGGWELTGPHPELLRPSL